MNVPRSDRSGDISRAPGCLRRAILEDLCVLRTCSQIAVLNVNAGLRSRPPLELGTPVREKEDALSWGVCAFVSCCWVLYMARYRSTVVVLYLVWVDLCLP